MNPEDDYPPQHQLMKFPRNRHGRDFFVGDIHGCYQLFMEELEQVEFAPERDRVFCVGDLIDRGPESYRCLQLMFEPWFHSVRGNHELMMAEVILGKVKPTPWWGEGGGWSLDENQDALTESAGRALYNMPTAIEVETAQGTIGVVHADVTSNTWGKFNQDADVWSRRRFQAGVTDSVKGIDMVVVGHTILDEPQVVGNVLHLDTGAFMTGNLTLLEASEVANLILQHRSSGV